jgi:two-component system sensor histidine kinase UhpB
VAAARQAAGQLLESHERLERVSRALVRAQEDERRRVAADLHDDLGQLLTALKLGLERARSSTDPHALATALAEGARLAGRAIEEVGRLARRLRPAVLDDLGLAVALESLACEAASSAGLALELEIDHEVSRRDPEVELACYRITQEAVNNTMRHADARWLRVAFSGDAESIRLEVQDDGLGFDPQSPRPGPGLGLGLEGMAERAELLGGRLEVSSLPGRGTRVVARFPAPEPEPESGSAGRRHLPEGAAS